MSETVERRYWASWELSLEVRAKNEAGYDDHARRTITENAKNLGRSAAEFE